MKNLNSRLVMATVLLLFIVFTSLGIVLGQFFPFIANAHTDELQGKYWIFLNITLTLAFLISVFIATKIIRAYAKPVDDITKVAQQIVKGEYLSRSVDGQEDSDELAQAVHQIGHQLEAMKTLRAMEKERFRTLVESMGSGLLMFGREGAVNLSNRTFELYFGFARDECIGKTFKNIGLPSAVEELIENVFMTEEAHEGKVRVDKQGAVTHLSVYGAPVIGRHGNWLGIIVVTHDITELVHLEEVRTDFVANVSHELRTPVTSIKGFAETLLDGAMHDPVVGEEFLKIIQKESDRLSLLINDLLALSGMERDGFTLHIQNADIAAIIQEAVNAVSRMQETMQMTIDIEMAERIIIEADADRLVQVMVNLLSNAITYSKERTTILVAVRQQEDELIIEVKDEGIGIAQAELPRLFERFYRVDRARSRDSGGTGLGLAIVKHIIEVHKGTVEVESRLGEGTTFRLRLPVRQS